MERLTKAEEEIMQYIWQLERCTVSQIIDAMEATPRPPHSSISSIVRILEKKEYVGYKAYGKTYEYFPLVSKSDYGKRSLRKVLTDYFNGSANSLVSFLVQEKELDAYELNALLNQLNNHQEDQP